MKASSLKPLLPIVFLLYLNTDTIAQSDPGHEFLPDHMESIDSAVMKLCESNRYSFQVLLDDQTDRVDRVSYKFGLEGLPTQYFIDKNGYIRFQTSGTPLYLDKTVDQISARIELVRNFKSTQ